MYFLVIRQPGGLIYSRLFLFLYCKLEQWLARWAHNPEVTGSSPVLATIKVRPVPCGASHEPVAKAEAGHVPAFCFIFEMS